MIREFREGKEERGAVDVYFTIVVMVHRLLQK